MSNKEKRTKGTQLSHEKRTTQPPISADKQHMIWIFDEFDNEGYFRFSLAREDMKADAILQNILDYSCRTWIEIKQETHDKSNKSCNHFLTDYDGYSKAAKERINKLGLSVQIRPFPL